MEGGESSPEQICANTPANATAVPGSHCMRKLFKPPHDCVTYFNNAQGRITRSGSALPFRPDQSQLSISIYTPYDRCRFCNLNKPTGRASPRYRHASEIQNSKADFASSSRLIPPVAQTFGLPLRPSAAPRFLRCAIQIDQNCCLQASMSATLPSVCLA